MILNMTTTHSSSIPCPHCCDGRDQYGENCTACGASGVAQVCFFCLAAPPVALEVGAYADDRAEPCCAACRAEFRAMDAAASVEFSVALLGGLSAVSADVELQGLLNAQNDDEALPFDAIREAEIERGACEMAEVLRAAMAVSQ